MLYSTTSFCTLTSTTLANFQFNVRNVPYYPVAFIFSVMYRNVLHHHWYVQVDRQWEYAIMPLHISKSSTQPETWIIVSIVGLCALFLTQLKICVSQGAKLEWPVSIELLNYLAPYHEFIFSAENFNLQLWNTASFQASVYFDIHYLKLSFILNSKR